MMFEKPQSEITRQPRDAGQCAVDVVEIFPEAPYVSKFAEADNVIIIVFGRGVLPKRENPIIKVKTPSVFQRDQVRLYSLFLVFVSSITNRRDCF